MAIDGKRIRIRGPMQFRTGGYYMGRNRMCRVLSAPALGSTPKDEPRYVVYEPGLWFATAFQDIDLQKSFVPSPHWGMWYKTFLGNYKNAV